MKKYLSFFLFLSLISQTLFSQTWSHGYTPYFRHINDVHISSLDVIVAVGGRETNDAIEGVFKTQTYGINWDIITDIPFTPWLKDAHFISDSLGFAAGFEGKIRKTTNLGTTWTTLNSGTTRHLNGIFFSNGQTGFCAGGNRTEPNQTIIKTTDEGQNWSVVHDAADFWLRDIYFVNQNTGVAVGDSGVGLYSGNAGDSWQTLTMPLVRHYHSIHFVDESTGFIAGGNFENSTILKSIDGGYSWFVIKDEAGGELHDIYFIDENIGYAVGAKGAFLKTTDGGDNWTQLVIPNLTQDVILNTVLFKNQDFGIAIGQWGEFFILKSFPPAIVQTVSATSNTEGNANFTCRVNTNGTTSNLSVIYGYDQELSSPQETGITLVNTSYPTNMNVVASGFAPNTVYYYSCKVSNITQSYYGDTLAFQYVLIPPDVLVLPATAVTNTSAILNGSVKGLEYPSDIFFEYSLIDGTVITVPATPSFIDDTLYHSVSAAVSGLLDDSVYTYRLKVVRTTTQITEYSHYGYVHTGLNTIPNFDFEDWTDVSGISLDTWKNIFGPVERVAGYSGNYAAKLERSLQSVGIILLGFIGEGLGSTIGIPYTGSPDSIQVMLNYDIVAGDTGYIVVQLKHQGQIIGGNMIPITGNSSGNFQLVKHKINYTSSETGDELTLGFICSNLINENLPPVYGSYMIVDDVSFPGNFQQPPNPGFENWINFSYPHCNNWMYLDQKNFNIYDNSANQMVNRVNDAQNGNYAVILKNIMIDNNPQIILPAELALSPNPDEMSLSFDHNKAAFPVNHKPRALNGFYKFFPQGGDTLNIRCEIYKDTMQLAISEIIIDVTMDTYSPFDLKLFYNNDTLQPDSAFIEIKILNHPLVHTGSIAYIDNLRFDGFTTDFPISQPEISEPENEPFVLLYPNPGKEILNIEMQNMEAQNARIEIMDISGRIICSVEKLLNENAASRAEINTAAFQQGLYLVRVTAGKTLKIFRWLKM